MIKQKIGDNKKYTILNQKIKHLNIKG